VVHVANDDEDQKFLSQLHFAKISKHDREYNFNILPRFERGQKITALF